LKQSKLKSSDILIKFYISSVFLNIPLFNAANMAVPKVVLSIFWGF